MQENSQGIYKKIEKLVKSTGQNEPFAIFPLIGGNNKVFELRFNGHSIIAKYYYSNRTERNKRLKSEYGLCKFAWNHNIRTPPRPIARSQEDCLALYEFIKGRKVRATDISKTIILNAVDFYLNLNKALSTDGSSENFPPAAESNFSIKEHIRCIGNRIKRLSFIASSSRINRQAISFVQNGLRPTWLNILDKTSAILKEQEIDTGAVLPKAKRRLSPSDFGFHNAILTEDGMLRFIDFEYAGMDDPAKMVCDFFCQIAEPVPISYFNIFTTGVGSLEDDVDIFRKRIEILFPLYHIKWCCIILNEFLCDGMNRRHFARAGDDINSVRTNQLKKAESLLKKTRTQFL